MSGASSDQRLTGFYGRKPTSYPVAPRFRETEWKGASNMNHKSAEAAQQWAETLMANSVRVANETEELRLRGQTEVNWHLNQRVQDIQLWISELAPKSEEINERMEELKCYIERVKEALKSLPSIYEANVLILRHRDGRMGIELVNDDPQRQVFREMELIKTLEGMSLHWIKHCEETLRTLRKFWIELSNELEDKKTALKIDTLAISFNQHSPQVQRQETINIGNYRHVENEAEWEEIAAKYKKSADNILKLSGTVQLQVQSFLRQFCEELQKQVCESNAAFEKKLVEIREAKSKLEFQHNQISIRIREMEQVIDTMKKSLSEKESTIALTETRLSVRNQRPNRELVNDTVQRRLHLELLDLKQSMHQMGLQINQSKTGLRHLLAQQLQLQQEINLKVQSIAIDETQVLPIRKTIHLTNH